MFVWSTLSFVGLQTDQKAAWRMLNVESPIIKSLDLSSDIKTLRGDVENNGDIYRQPPSPSTDDAWNRLNQDNLAWATSKDLKAAGKDIDVAVKFPPSLGFGDDAYPVLVDVKHKIHCLNRIRKDVYFDYYWKDKFPDGNATDLHKSHTDHCIYILLQSLMCDANTDFVPYAWYDIYDHPHPDFMVNRKCGDFDGVTKWTEDHKTVMADIFDIKKPEGQETLSMSTDLLRILSQTDG
ncbi:hypothetical protein ONS96_004294 [Cadophora gregata f. sp. sojae]|nr:hypothetical protein ONS96_004294 [Cadophora gregata f. sp. sojae]